MLNELRPQRLAHDVILNGFPAKPQHAIAAATHIRGEHGHLSQSDGFLVIRARKFLRLKIMFSRWPELALQLNRIRREVGKVAVGLIYSIEKNLLHRSLLLSFGQFQESIVAGMNSQSQDFLEPSSL